MAREILFITDAPSPNDASTAPDDGKIKEHLEKALHYRVLEIRAEGRLWLRYLAHKELIILSSGIREENSADITEKLWNEPVPVLILNEDCVDGMKLDLKRATSETAEGLYKWETASLGSESEPLPAARRAAYFFAAKPAAGEWLVFDSAVRWAVSLKTPEEVFEEEWGEIARRRYGPYKSLNSGKEIETPGFYDKGGEVEDEGPPENLVGLALSGGGIRSATFSLGLLQGLNQKGLLRIFDYFSTVSGGGFVGGWWSAWLARKENSGIFPESEQIELTRTNSYIGGGEKIFEGSMSAAVDPIHHLRLYSNYLTPRKGALSGDTWRAVAVVSRNLYLTWLSLLPILFGFILLGQFYFALQKNSSVDFFYPHQKKIEKLQNQIDAVPEEYQVMADRQATTLTDDEKKNLKNEETQKIARLKDRMTAWQDDYDNVLFRRALSVIIVLAALVGWILLMIAAWMRSNVTREPFLDWIAHTLSTLILLVLFASILRLFGVFTWTETWDRLRTFDLPEGMLAAVGLWVVVGIGLWAASWPKGIEGDDSRKEIRRNRITLIQGRLLICLVLATFVLALSGYGYDLANYTWFGSPREFLSAYIAKAGGIAAFLLSIVGSIYTAVKASPTGGEDQKKGSEVGAMGGLLLLITPPLVIISLTIFLAWLSRQAVLVLIEFYGAKFDKGALFNTKEAFLAHLSFVQNYYERPLTVAVYIGIALGFFLAVYEIRQWSEWRRPLLVYLGLLAISALGGWGIWLLKPQAATQSWDAWKGHWFLSTTFVFWVAILFVYRIFLFRPKRPDGWIAKFRSLPLPKKLIIGNLIALILAALLAYLSGLGAHQIDPPTVRWEFVALALAAMLFSAIVIMWEMASSYKNTGRTVYLLAIEFVLLAAFLFNSFFHDPVRHASVASGYLILVMVTLAFSWTIAIGWMADPNWLSLHQFYKSRLVRAYMGASNMTRKKDDREITESCQGDDVLMQSLLNVSRGAPYHIVNTTLNLVGGKDLVTAQRSSAAFEFARLYAGSLRTGYRLSSEYKGGLVSLGTAVSVSGAAVSPNMGAKTLTSAIAMLLTLLNIRLGFWAPTPNRSSWRSIQARLWPFYTLVEFLSQTNDLASYCYLTDGGHFDNTGLYTLVQRGCRYIVISDNGADAQPCFEDLGDAIRRCRIDFGAEIDLLIEPLFKTKDEASGDNLAKRHYVVGRITYSPEHLESIGWSRDASENENHGIIIYIKPTLLRDEGADIRQYARQHADFPQQSTANQWFDEAQFESYRKLGYHIAERVVEELEFEQMIEENQRLTPGLIADAFERAKEVYDQADALKEPEESLISKQILTHHLETSIDANFEMEEKSLIEEVSTNARPYTAKHKTPRRQHTKVEARRKRCD